MFVRTLRNSLFNLGYYRQVKDAPLAFSVKYLFGLLTATALVFFLPLAAGIVLILFNLPQTIRSVVKEAENIYPAGLVLTVADKKLSTNVPEPYYVSLFGQKGRFLTIDTKASPADFARLDSYLLVTKTSIVSDGSTVPIGQIAKDGVLNQKTYLGWLRGFYPYLKYAPQFLAGTAIFLVTIGPVLAGAAALPFRLAYLAVFCLLVTWPVRAGGFSYSFRQVYKMAIHASTLPTVFFTLLAVLGLSPAIPFGYSLVLVLFFGAIIYANRRES